MAPCAVGYTIITVGDGPAGKKMQNVEVLVLYGRQPQQQRPKIELAAKIELAGRCRQRCSN